MSEAKSPLDRPVMRGKRTIANNFTEIVAQQLHYFENVDKVDLSTCKAADIVDMIEGSLQRYRSDPIFQAKVKQLVARLMQALDA